MMRVISAVMTVKDWKKSETVDWIVLLVFALSAENASGFFVTASLVFTLLGYKLVIFFSV